MSPAEPDHRENLFPGFDPILGRETKEALLGHRGRVLWFYGLSGSGKSTLANALERRLHHAGILTVLLDGDNIRTGLNNNLGFSDEDREENLRRIAEVAKLFAGTGVVTLTSFITPLRRFRDMARSIIGEHDFNPIYVKASFETCARRDVKGLYAKAARGDLKQFTGRDSGFEEPLPGEALVVDTEQQSIEQGVDQILGTLPLIK
jgi:adenylylsulfate kinase